MQPRAPSQVHRRQGFLRSRSRTDIPAIKNMRTFPSVLPAVLALFATVAAAQTPQQQPATLEERMTQADLKASGQPVFYPDSSARENVESHIDGLFTGWHGHTVFKLDNGQEWKQAESGAYDAGKFQDPVVRIKPMLLGSWLMYVEGCGCSVRVNRIK